MQNVKKNLRQLYTQKRLSLSKAVISDWSLAIAKRCLDLPLWDRAIFHLFWPIEKQNEVNTGFLLSSLWNKRKKIALPKMEGDLTLSHYLFSEQDGLQENKWGISEPKGGTAIEPNQIDVVFVPLLIADMRGHRVGYGKGIYDRFLKECSFNTIKVGLSFFEPIAKIDDVDINDIPLNYCVTPKCAYPF